MCGPGEPDDFAQVVNEQQSRFDRVLVWSSVDRDTDRLSHCIPLAVEQYHTRRTEACGRGVVSKS